jgi:putative aldouronate transport system permease protein
MGNVKIAENRSSKRFMKSVKSNRKKVKWNMKRNWPLYAMLVPGFIFIILFSYTPMYGVIIAFQDFQPVSGFLGSEFVGLKWFRYLLDMPDFKNVFGNTLVIALYKMFFGQLVPILFALLLNEIRHDLYKRSIQTLVYLPNFLSWVIVGGIFIDLLSTKGIINKFLNVFGINSIFFLGSNDWFRFTLVATDVWKGFGFGAIIYLAALSGINPELYESAMIDGANRWKQTLHITLPGIIPTIILLATLNLGNVLNAGFEQVLMFYNPAVYQTGDIIDTFVYRAGLIDAQFSLATAVGLFKSVISFFLIVISYKLAHKFANYRIF